ncbi:phage major capsid protein [Deinococcus kurensis]|uniref:phage major capsid protein n=1 Tax=Deinococcus kurensis TaxID=2662757 RepID=UPI0012D35754|nr:hypothetical protein [Deinococcus kurensis]
MSRTLYARMQLAEARGQIPQGAAGRLTDAMIAETAAMAFARGYYGDRAVEQALTDARQERVTLPRNSAEYEQHTLNLADQYVDGARSVVRTLVDTHTTSDFPQAFANLRQRTVRASDAPDVESAWRTWGGVRTRTVNDFRTVNGIKLTIPGDLLLRPEGSDVKYTTFGETTDGYRAGNYERAWKYTWEMHLADDIGLLTAMANEMGGAAKRTEIRVIFEAIKAGLTLKTGGTYAGAIDITKLRALRTLFGSQTFKNDDKKDEDLGLDATDIVYGIDQRDLVYTALNQITVDGTATGLANPLRGVLTPHFERMWRRIFGADYLLFDRTVNWLEVAFLEGFQGGAKFYAKVPDVDRYEDEGSFNDHSLHGKVGHALGAKIVSDTGAWLAKGS